MSPDSEGQVGAVANQRTQLLLRPDQLMSVDSMQNCRTNLVGASNFSREGKNLDPNGTANERNVLHTVSQIKHLCLPTQPAAFSFWFCQKVGREFKFRCGIPEHTEHSPTPTGRAGLHSVVEGVSASSGSYSIKR